MASNPQRNTIINDAVFGSIEFPPICMKIINTPEFQRLRFLQQLGVTPFVYPSANHSRFEHSIGVYHVAKQMMEKLKAKQEKLLEDFPNGVDESDKVVIDKKNGLIDERDILCVTIAALCHDLGHGPFSHIWEAFMKRVKVSDSEDDWKHEALSLKLFDKICKRLDLTSEGKIPEKEKKIKITEEEKEFIKDLMVGVDESKKNGKAKGFLYEIVANKRNGLDVDKFAYITQDSYFLGIKTSFDYARVIEMAQVVRNNENDGSNELCYKISEQANVYYVFLSRWNLHRRAYRHRVTRLIEKMLVDAFVNANKQIVWVDKDGKERTLSETHLDLDEYINMEDSLLHRILQLPDSNQETKDAKELIRRIRERDLYTEVKEIPIPTMFSFVEKEKEIKEFVLKESKKARPDITGELFDVDIQRFNFGQNSKDPNANVSYYKNEVDNNGQYKPVYVKCEDRQPSALLKFCEEIFVSLIWKPSRLAPPPQSAEKSLAIKEAFDEWYKTWEASQASQPQ